MHRSPRIALTVATLIGAGAASLMQAKLSVAQALNQEDRRDSQASTATDRYGADLFAREQGHFDEQPDPGTIRSALPRDREGNEYTCTTTLVSLEQQPLTKLVEQPKGQHSVYRHCQYVSAALLRDTVQGAPPTGFFWEPDAPATISLDTVLAEARERLRPPQPILTTWPSDQFVVGVPTRFRVENYAVVDAGAQTPNVQVWARAEPFRAVYTFGDGTTLECGFAGKPFTGGDDNAPDACKHTFTHSTGGPVSGTVEILYRVTWWSNLDPTPQVLPDIRSATLSFGYGVRGYEAVGR